MLRREFIAGLGHGVAEGRKDRAPALAADLISCRPYAIRPWVPPTRLRSALKVAHHYG
jgi:hypothetical protein